MARIIRVASSGTFFFFSEAEFLCVDLAVLELLLQTRLSLNSKESTCLSLLSVGIEGVCPPKFCYFLFSCHLFCYFLCFPGSYLFEVTSSITDW